MMSAFRRDPMSTLEVQLLRSPINFWEKLNKKIAALTSPIAIIKSPATVHAAGGGRPLRSYGRQGLSTVGRLDSSVPTLTVRGAYRTGESLEGSPPPSRRWEDVGC